MALWQPHNRLPQCVVIKQTHDHMTESRDNLMTTFYSYLKIAWPQLVVIWPHGVFTWKPHDHNLWLYDNHMTTTCGYLTTTWPQLVVIRQPHDTNLWLYDNHTSTDSVTWEPVFAWLWRVCNGRSSARKRVRKSISILNTFSRKNELPEIIIIAFWTILEGLLENTYSKQSSCSLYELTDATSRMGTSA